MESSEDQSRLVLFAEDRAVGSYPVVVAMHGQPPRGKAPRDYRFAPIVLAEVEPMVERSDVRPFILALPVFRFLGQNWPGFDLSEFRAEVDALLAEEGIRAEGYYVFGHSGAAGCGGDGMNRPLRLAPQAVAFVDTCLGSGFRRGVRDLHEAKVPTILLHSAETAGFVPRQAIEYSSSFDFGRAYEPLGIVPTECPPDRPDVALRDQPYRCAKTPDGVVRAFVVDTGEGEPAHEEALRVGTRYFLKTFIGKR